MIAAVSADWGIGKNNDLLFYIKEDLRRFKSLTLGNVVVMGHNTYKSLPERKPDDNLQPSGRALPGRKNIVLSSNITLQLHDAEVCNSLESLHEALKCYDSEKIFIIGGAQIYRQLLPECTRAYITKVASSPAADVFFPDLDSLAEWKLTAEGDIKTQGGLIYRYVEYLNEGEI